MTLELVLGDDTKFWAMIQSLGDDTKFWAMIPSEQFSFRVFQRHAVTSDAPRGKGETMFDLLVFGGFSHLEN